ncbi:MAG: hypothetical protein JJE25_09130 [Bacteroidia bacterium]|nr:hypothetical protein [Bacteroidia bacterium]
MKRINQVTKIFLGIILIIVMDACEKDYFYEPPPPPTSEQTSTLEAIHVSTPPSSINSEYWQTADYLKINSQDVSINQLYLDGLLNMTGTYGGLASFNNGTDPGLFLKAAYDENNLYILAEWTDLDVNISKSSWLFNGPVDPLKADPNAGWTSQRNCDKFAMAFEISTASSPAGTFSNVGCAASCHNVVGTPVMYPTSGKVDLWNWNLALSAPLGYAEDMVANSDSIADDSGQKMYARNSTGTTDRSGPAYEWDGTSQIVTLANSQSSTLDPAFYLFNKTAFIGDIHRGDSIFNRTSPPGDCASCHGNVGQGATEGPINLVRYNKKSRTELMLGMDNVGDMSAYWTPLSASDKNDIVAFLRGLSGVPGYYLTTPDGSNADIKAVSNVTAANIFNAMNPTTNHHAKYQVLMIRNLRTNNADDIQFNGTSGSTYKFGVALMNNDGKNHIGSTVETLTFK